MQEFCDPASRTLWAGCQKCSSSLHVLMDASYLNFLLLLLNASDCKLQLVSAEAMIDLLALVFML